MAFPARLYVPVFTAALVLSAFLLFSVEPMLGKMILPLLGGSPQTWNTAMLFFQAMLLGGYFYAHLSSRYLSAGRQAALQLVLLCLCLVFLPLAIPAGWPEPDTGYPIRWQLWLMTAVAGAPFFMLAANAPMIQRWFAQTDHKDAHSPYFLYAASNAGSMAALLAYPSIIEMTMGTHLQSVVWAFGYGLLIALSALAAVAATRLKPKASPAETRDATRPSLQLRMTWVKLAFIPSSLMLSVTTYITTDIASIPLLWVFPLALYLLTFIIAFARRSRIGIDTSYLFQSALMAIIAVLFIRNLFGVSFYPAALHLALFFFCALTCHLCLAARKPPVQHLTDYYLYISLGGVLGGAFNTLIAPIAFPVPFEYPLGLAAAMLAPFLAGHLAWNRAELGKHKYLLAAACAASLASIFIAPIVFAVIIMALLLRLIDRNAYLALSMALIAVFIFHPGYDWSTLRRTLFLERNFFGVSKVLAEKSGDVRIFMNGTTVHGAQAQIDPYQLTPLTYYYPGGPAGDAFRLLTSFRPGPQKIAALGLGAGSIACHAQAGRSFDFYEIDPTVIEVAQDPKLFTFLSGCNSPYTITQGDARLRIAAAPDASYDMIFLDVFSSDSIPVHMITQEAFEIYFRKLKPDGLLVANISNRHLGLKPLVASIAGAVHAEARFRTYRGITLKAPDVKSASASYAIVSRNTEALHTLGPDWTAYDGAPMRVWTDDYANILGLLHKNEH